MFLLWFSICEFHPLAHCSVKGRPIGLSYPSTHSVKEMFTAFKNKGQISEYVAHAKWDRKLQKNEWLLILAGSAKWQAYRAWLKICKIPNKRISLKSITPGLIIKNLHIGNLKEHMWFAVILAAPPPHRDGGSHMTASHLCYGWKGWVLPCDFTPSHLDKSDHGISQPAGWGEQTTPN